MLNIQKLDFLIAFYSTCVAISELMGAKTFPIVTLGTIHLSASTAIFVVPLVYAINDIVTEVYGKARAQSVVRTGLFMVFFLMLFSLLATHLPPTQRFSATEYSYETIFSISARISASSLIAFALGEFLDVLLFAKLRKRFGTKNLWLRTNISNFASQFFDTSFFLLLAFYNFSLPFNINASFLIGLILPYWLLKCFMSVIETPFVYLGVHWLERKEVGQK